MWFMTARFNNITMLIYPKQPLSFPQWLGNRLVKSPELDTDRLILIAGHWWSWNPHLDLKTLELSSTRVKCSIGPFFDLDFPLMLAHAYTLGCSQRQSSSWLTSSSISPAMGPAAPGTGENKEEQGLFQLCQLNCWKHSTSCRRLQ